MAISLSQLQAQLQQPTYTAMTEEEMRTQAQNKYNAIYQQNRLSAQQAYETSDLALEQQLGELIKSYGNQATAAQKATRQSLSGADRYSLSRGMQRSSYNNATLANINLEGDRTLNAIAQNLTDSTNDVNARRALLSQQLAQQLAGYDTQYESDVQAYIDTLRQQEYERQQAAMQYQNELMMQLYEYGQAARRSSGGGRSSRRSSGGGSSPQVNNAQAPLTSALLSASIAAAQKAKRNGVGTSTLRAYSPNAYMAKK